MDHQENHAENRRIKGVWLILIAFLLSIVFATINAYVDDRVTLPSNYGLVAKAGFHGAKFGGIFVVFIGVGLIVSFVVGALNKDLRSRNTTPFWLRAIAVAVVIGALFIAINWKMASQERTERLADITITPTSMFASLAMDWPQAVGLTVRVFQVARDETFCSEKLRELNLEAKGSCPECVISSSECIRTIPRRFDYVLSAGQGLYPYVQSPGRWTIYLGRDRHLREKLCQDAARNFSSDAECVSGEIEHFARTQAPKPVPVPKGDASPGLIEAARNGDLRMIQALVANGANVNARSPLGFSALSGAASKGHTEVVKFLLENGVNVNEKLRFGSNALDQASFGGHVSTVELLLAKGADVNIRKDESNGYTPLLSAATMGHISVVKLLLERGAEVNARDSHGSTALHSAALQKNNALIQLLLKHGADPSIKNAGGYSYKDVLNLKQ